MERDGRSLLVCNCEVSMPLDGKRLREALGATGEPEVQTQLCRAQLGRFRRALEREQPVLVGCTQEVPLFEETRGETGQADVRYVNLREQAGWSDEGAAALPKIAALIAEAGVEIEPTPTVSLTSGGDCLVYGDGEVALDAAVRLARRLGVTLLLREAADLIPPRTGDVPIFRGRIASVTGHLGAFEVTIEDHAPALVSSRAALAFGAAQGRVSARCDLILDLSAGMPLVPAPDKRDGYLRPDPGDPRAVERALFDLTDLVGEFEKPRYVDFRADLCAHSRSRRTGCTRCLDVCPASAIEPAGDTVRIDPLLCGGCGACHSVCPTGAASYAYPPAGALLERARTLLGTYRRAGGEAPVLLVHDQSFGAEVISLMSRLGRGLPARVIPFGVNEVTQIGLDWLLAAFAYGAEQILFLVAPRRTGETAGLEAQIRTVDSLLTGLGYGAGRAQVVEAGDPEVVEGVLHGLPRGAPLAQASFLPVGGKRTVMRQAAAELHEAAPEPVDDVPLPEGAPFGRIVVETGGCTLCLACVSVCPTGAVRDDPSRPQLAFQEDACVQCGLCANTCPEHVITLDPRLAFTDQARQAVVLKSEEPALCVRCGKPFGTRSSIEKIVAALAEKHWMFQDAAAIERIRMCDDCRVVAQFEATDNPFAAGPRPPTRTTDDDLRERGESEARRRAERDEN